MERGPASLPLVHGLTPPTQTYVLEFGGDRIVIGPRAVSLDLGPDFTMESWVYLEDRSPYGIIMGKTHNPRNSDPFVGFVLSFTSSGNHVEFVQTTGQPGSYRNATASSDFPLRVWTHVAATLTGGIMRLFVNGTNVATGQSLGLSKEPDVPFAIGNGATSNGQVTCCGVIGSIRQASVWSRALATYELATNSGQHLRGDETGLVAYWPMDDGSGQTVRDLGRNALHLQRGTSAGVDPADPRWVHDSILENSPLAFKRFDLPSYYSKYSSYWAEGILVNFDSDGYLDVLVALFSPPSTPGPLLAFRNDRHGGFYDATAQVLGNQPIQFVNPRDFAVADFDKSGRMDVFIADHGPDAPPFPGGHSRLLIQTADGRLIDETSARIPDLQDAFTHSIAVGDVNGDGYPDIYVGNIGDQHHNSPRLYINDGTGHFTACATCLPSPLTDLQQKYTTARFVDVNKSGHLDLVLGGMPGTGLLRDAILLNDGKGHFSFAPETMIPLRYGDSNWGTVNLSTADFGGDGLPDILMATTGGGVDNYQSSRLQLLVNNGDGSYRDASDQVPQTFLSQTAGSGDRWVKWVNPIDWNADGKIGFVTSGVGIGSHAYLNIGGGHFRDVSEILPMLPDTYCCYVMLPGDLDNDGHTDIFILGAGFFGVARYQRAFDSSLFQTPPVMLSEVELDSGATVTAGQWVKLHNGEDRVVNISGWALQNGVGNITVTFENQVIPSYGNVTLGLDGQRLSHQGERLILFDLDERQVDATRVIGGAYGDCGTWRWNGTQWSFSGCAARNAMFLSLAIPLAILLASVSLLTVFTVAVMRSRRNKRTKVAL